MDYHAIITKLIGPIEPIGDTIIDELRLNNLISLCMLVDRLIGDIDKVASNKTRTEYSMKCAGEYADNFLTSLGIEE